MISKTSEEHFDQLWSVFNQWWTDMGGTALRVNPLKRYFPNKFAESLTEEKAGAYLHLQLTEWGRIERKRLRLKKQKYFQVPEGGPRVPIPREMDKKHNWSRAFVRSAFYNLCCLATYGKTIEELVFTINESRSSRHCTVPQLKALQRLISFSKSFLLAEWVQRMILKAISNEDDRFFLYLAKALVKDAAKPRFHTARQWLGTAVLWYLGGKDIHPRQEFVKFLKDKKILPNSIDETSFRAMLGNLGLTRQYVSR